MTIETAFQNFRILPPFDSAGTIGNMKKLIIIVLLLYPFSNIHSQSIKESFNRYCNDVADRNGLRVVQFFSKEADVYWDGILKSARTLKKSEILTLSTYKCLSILFIRKRAEKYNDIWVLTGKEWLILSYNNGWNSNRIMNLLNSQPDSFELVEKITGDVGHLQLIYKGQSIPQKIQFVRRNGKWLLDSSWQVRMIEESIENARKVLGLSKQDYIDLIYSGVFGEKPSKSLWFDN